MSNCDCALVVGAGTDIGQAVAHAFGCHGYEVLATGHRVESVMSFGRGVVMLPAEGSFIL